MWERVVMWGEEDGWVGEGRVRWYVRINTIGAMGIREDKRGEMGYGSAGLCCVGSVG